MSKDRDGSVRARRITAGWQARYKYAGHWLTVKNGDPPCATLFSSAHQAKEAAYAMYNVACNGGKHQ